ncbi:hypothetical protein [Halomonas nitroreducens]|uniref:Penicillin-binding protein activator LpoB n=1 Tax=Halomonas nitroreducens TaxID=447425 RepID=A0A3S0JBL2_9GAMM|nr:hypothetical protein [Halomonas nitroreducens]RTR05580.1 hypothetical protein EKG36_05660 [Halomonas nitroreducens]
MTRRLPLLLLPLLVLAGCAGAPEPPQTVRQALLGLGKRAAEQVATTSALPRPTADQVLLLAMPEVDPDLQVDDTRLLESLTRALLGIEQGPQVLDWQPTLSEGAGRNQWRLDSRLMATGPRLTLSDRQLLPYRLKLALRRPGDEGAVWESQIDGALDASAL